MMEAHITGLTIYPVKSLSGINLNQVNANASGLEGDRQWGIINADGQILTQRKHPHMATIGVAITPNGLRLSTTSDNAVDVTIPAPDSPLIDVKVWQDQCSGQVASQEVNQWLTDTLKSQTHLRLLHLNADSERRFAKPERFNIRGQFLSDAAPYLIANQNSVDALNQSLENASIANVDVRNFRANIVIAGAPAFSEHQYSKLREINAQYNFDLVDHCQRCSMITVDPDTGNLRPKATPFTQLSALNSMPNHAKAPAFGVNSTLRNSGTVSLAIGQKVILS